MVFVHIDHIRLKLTRKVQKWVSIPPSCNNQQEETQIIIKIMTVLLSTYTCQTLSWQFEMQDLFNLYNKFTK